MNNSTSAITSKFYAGWTTKGVHLMCTNPPLTKECLMIDKKVELTNEDIQSVFDRMFSTGKSSTPTGFSECC